MIPVETLIAAIVALIVYTSSIFGVMRLFSARDRKMLAEQFQEIADRFEGVQKALHADIKGLAELEKDFLKFKATLPLEYVRKEDDVRNQTVINAKLDRLWTEFSHLKDKIK